MVKTDTRTRTTQRVDMQPKEVPKTRSSLLPILGILGVGAAFATLLSASTEDTKETKKPEFMPSVLLSNGMKLMLLASSKSYDEPCWQLVHSNGDAESIWFGKHSEPDQYIYSPSAIMSKEGLREKIISQLRLAAMDEALRDEITDTLFHMADTVSKEDINRYRDLKAKIVINGKHLRPTEYWDQWADNPVTTVTIDNSTYVFKIIRAFGKWHLSINGTEYHESEYIQDLKKVAVCYLYIQHQDSMPIPEDVFLF